MVITESGLYNIILNEKGLISIILISPFLFFSVVNRLFCDIKVKGKPQSIV